MQVDIGDTITAAVAEIAALRNNRALQLLDSGVVSKEWVEKHILQMPVKPSDIIVVKLSGEDITPGAFATYAKRHGDIIRMALDRAGHASVPILVVRKDTDLSALHVPSEQEIQNQHDLEVKRLRFQALRDIAFWGFFAISLSSLALAFFGA